MIISANQPYFAPFPGLFYKILCSDIFVVLDDIQFPRGFTWMTRNRFKNDQGTLWMTIPVQKKGLGLQNIDAVRIYHEGRWACKHLSSLKNAYANAPYFKEHLPLLDTLFASGFLSGFEKLIDLNLEIIRYLLKLLDIDTKMILLSELGIQARGNRLLIEICRALGASRYLAQSPARKYLDPDLFRDAGIELTYFRPPSLIYPQLWGSFIPNLSAFDLVFNCGPKARAILTAAKETIP
ncbi:MAG: WbqC family protein [Pseudomonadota bacterium]|uniref:WbqC family protein n=1 Tax=Candidatus Desulfatibia profunda TaxID=2841695 RepID=A0A8J6NS31_9BACT|nr:WbqC family protein [Candidatus Desulfatibia profunda]MBL7180194.1 WbqC family protein [Desulfobacterales bacterium]